MATMTELHSRPITTNIGSVIEGIDLSEPLCPRDRDFIGSELYNRGVVFFRGQDLNGEQMKAFVSNFAKLQAAKFTGAAKDDTGLVADFGATKQFTAIWHADGTFAEEPVLFTALRAVSVPDVGGDTCWSSMYAAYEALSEPMRAMLDGLTAIHSVEPVVRRLGAMGQAYGERAREMFGAEHAHPAVLVHPDTGRKALYVNSSWTTRIVELTAAESAKMLDLLFEHIKQPDFCMRWHWSANDMVIWDNRCVQHYAVPDYAGQRMMQRVDTEGQKPCGIDD
ncbi:MAG: TauD/TfdA family dioxygenase [Novosphingobium sp.]|nr:TauD/TfdA family dioxygenase [Novosphingobium sp.]MCB2080811.1 TauD/TfdA family dioxygenase [Novosphingobium sp.]